MYALRLWHAAKSFLRDESGPTATEYAVMLALVLLVCLASIGALGQGLQTSFEDSRQTMFP